ncbi:MAG: acyl-CoA dehydrogenase [Planctomycetes bacterium]|nr:acyl-CoA dehydrogenase [Planctomycetota bacterium]
MFSILSLTILTAVVLGYLGVPFIVWTLAAAGLLALAGAAWWAWGLFAIPAIFFNIRPLRSKVLSTRVAAALKKLGLLPTISETERVALEAGTVWMEGELFSGKPSLKTLAKQDYPSELRPDEQAFLDGPVEEVCHMTDEWKNWRDQDLPPEVWDFLKRERFFGMIIPKEFGGLGLSAMGVSAAIQKLASRSFPVSVTVMIPNSLGPAELIGHYGTEAQKKDFLPKLANGEHMPCFALTEPGAGSDAGSLGARGVVFRGEDGKPMMRLAFQKRYTSLATVSTILGLAFKLDDPEEILGKGKKLGITCALIPTTTPGIEADRRHDPLGVPFHNCAVQGKDVVVSVDTIIGGVDGAGQGWKMLMDCLAAGRGVTLPASSVANAKIAARVAGAYSAVRHQFGMPVGKFEGIEEPLARLAGYTYLLEAARVYTCASIDAGEKPSVVSAIVKYHFTELSRTLINDGMDVMAGAGISRGPRNILAQGYIAAPIGITVEGANILTRSMIIFGQGAMRCHPFARAEVDALEAGDEAAFDRALWGHVGHLIRNGTRALLLSLSRGMLAWPPSGGPTARWWRKLSWSSASFALLSDIALIGLGGDLKRREKLSARLGDMLSWMYLGAATLRRFEAEGRKADDRALLDWAMATVNAKLQEAHEGVCANMPIPVVGAILRGPVALWSRLNPFASPPDDRAGAKVAMILREPSETRERLLAGLYLPTDPQQALGRIERALALGNEANMVFGKIKQAMREGGLEKSRPERALDAARAADVITESELATVHEALLARDDAIQVDSFPAAGFSDQVPTPGGHAKDESESPPPLDRQPHSERVS